MLRKRLAPALLALTLPLLAGCDAGSSIYANYKEIETLQLIQTIGIDRRSGGVELSVSSGTGTKDTPPTILSGSGGSVSQAMEQAQAFAEYQELFYAHARYVVLGQDAAREGIFDYLDYLQRSSQMRLSAGMFVVRGGDAKDLVAHVGGDKSDITDLLASLEREVKITGQSHVFSCKDVSVNLSSRGSSLVCAVAAVPIDDNVYSGKSGSTASRAGSSGQQSASGDSGDEDVGAGSSPAGDAGALAALPAGYGVLADWQLKTFLTVEQSWGANILLGMAGTGALSVKDSNGRTVTLSFSDADASFRPVWEPDGSLRTLRIPVELELYALEVPMGSDLSDPAYLAVLEEQVAAAVTGWIEETLAVSARLEADFLGIGQSLRARHPLRFSRVSGDWPALLGALDFDVSVHATVERSFELKDAVSGGEGR